eukprot:758761-Pelagomonas_calceolata.AAC.2
MVGKPKHRVKKDKHRQSLGEQIDDPIQPSTSRVSLWMSWSVLCLLVSARIKAVSLPESALSLRSPMCAWLHDNLQERPEKRKRAAEEETEEVG